jgi:hypothetical protein
MAKRPRAPHRQNIRTTDADTAITQESNGTPAGDKQSPLDHSAQLLSHVGALVVCVVCEFGLVSEILESRVQVWCTSQKRKANVVSRQT